jgi:uncharacterized protein (TIGR02145 family)
MKTIIFLIILVFSCDILFAQNYIIINNADGTEYIHIATDIEDVTFLDFDCGTATVLYSSKTYNTVLIGSQCWLKENLDVGTMVDGSLIQTDNDTIEKYCYNNDLNYCITNGGLYQWNEAMQYVTTESSQGICPPGWHIPTLAEFQSLSAEVGGSGNALKEIGQGTGGGSGTNTSGFSALLAGFCENGNFYNLGVYAGFWGSTEYGTTQATTLGLMYFDDSIRSMNHIKERGAIIRCVKN